VAGALDVFLAVVLVEVEGFLVVVVGVLGGVVGVVGAGVGAGTGQPLLLEGPAVLGQLSFTSATPSLSVSVRAIFINTIYPWVLGSMVIWDP
jgi:hypothetical protein